MQNGAEVRSEVVEQSIRETLHNLNKELAQDLEAVWNEAKRRLLESQHSAYGHSAGLTHSERVESNLSKLIPIERRGVDINATELFILSATACLHDNGKRDPLTEDHGKTGADDVRKNYPSYRLDKMQAHIVSLIIETHTNPRDRLYKLPKRHTIGNQTVHLRKLAALFCLANLLDCGYDRILKGADQNKLVTRFRRQVAGWDFAPSDRDTILIKAVPQDYNAEEDFQRGFQDLQREFEPITMELREAGYPYKLKPWIDDTYLKKIATTAGTQVRFSPGLDFYHESDKDIFKGRNTEILRLRWNVLNEASPISLLVGSSGAGKTSLIQAGLFPKLRRTGWQLAYCRLPIAGLTNQIVRNVWQQLLIGEPLPRTILETFERISKRYKDTKILIVLDQFENAFGEGESLNLEQALFAVMARRFPNIHVLISCQSEFYVNLADFFQKALISRRDIPECALSFLSRQGAKEAIEALLASLGIGVSPIPKIGTSLTDFILDDIKAQGRGFYPPYLQIVGTVLSEASQKTGKIITLELYMQQGRASTIIGRFLLNQLGKFGDRRELAEAILKALVGAGGLIKQRTLDELVQELRIDAASLREILVKMRRLVRPLESGRFEIIHPYLAQLVDQELVKEKERELKRVRDYLFSKSREYASTKKFPSPSELARLYLFRDHIRPMIRSLVC